MGDINENEHLVAWLDLLGFAGKMAGRPVRDLVDALDQVLLALEKTSTSRTQQIFGTSGKIEPAERPEVEVFQDTVVLWTPQATTAGMNALLSRVGNLLQFLPGRGIPMRGAISIGTLYSSMKDKKTTRPPMVVGSGVKHAHDWEAVVNMAGVVIDPRLELDTRFQQYLRGSAAFRYDVPTKTGRRSLLTVPRGVESEELAIHRMWPTPPGPFEGHPGEILENTRAYIRAWRLHNERLQAQDVEESG